MATFEDIIGRWQNIFDDLFEIAGAAEDTSVVTNLQVIDAAPAGLSGYIIVAGAAGGLNFRGPVVTLPGQVWTNGDFVNVLFRKGTNPIAMGAGSGSGSSAFRVSIVYNSTLANAIIEVDATGNVVVNSAQLDRDFTVNVDSGVGLLVVGSSGDVFFGGTVLGRNTDLDTLFDFSTADAIGIYGGGIELFRAVESTQDIVYVNPNQSDVDFEVGYNSGVALFSDGANGNVTLGADLTVTGGLVINEAGGDKDTRIESDTHTAALFVQGSDGFIGVNNATPANLIEAISETAALFNLITYADADASRFQSQRARGTLASPTAVTSGLTLITLRGEGWETTTPAFQRAGQISIEVAGALSGAKIPGRITFYTHDTSLTNAGDVANRMRITTGVEVGSPTGGDKGSGTINVATNIYLNNTAYTNPDFVLEHFFAGIIERFKDNPGAADYEGLIPLDSLRDYLEKHLHLPGRDDQTAGVVERFDLAQRWSEEAYLYITELHQENQALKARLDRLEARLEKLENGNNQGR